MTSLNHDFAMVSSWFYKYFIVLNPEKCSFMLTAIKDELQTNLVSNNVSIKNNQEESLLITNLTSPRMHFNNIAKMTNIKLNKLNRVRKYVAPEQETFLTSSFTESQFNDCHLIWMFRSRKSFHNNMHERSLRFIHQDYVSSFISLLVNANEKSIQ